MLNFLKDNLSVSDSSLINYEWIKYINPYFQRFKILKIDGVNESYISIHMSRKIYPTHTQRGLDIHISDVFLYLRHISIPVVNHFLKYKNKFSSNLKGNVIMLKSEIEGVICGWRRERTRVSADTYVELHSKNN